MQQSEGEQFLTEEEKGQWDHILKDLQEYLSTPEGIEMFERLESLFPSVHPKIEEVHVPLTPNEDRALAFIRRELKKGYKPSVRDVAKVLGFTSSRSGHRVLKALKAKGLF